MNASTFVEPVWWSLLRPEDRAAALEDYEERAAIMEHVGGLARREAERRAAELIAARWSDRALATRIP